MSNDWFTRFPPSDKALEACKEVVAEWKNDMGVSMNLEEITWKIAARVNSWIGPKSVEAGVKDLIGGWWTANWPERAVDVLAERLTRRLLAEELLGRPVLTRALQRPEALA